MVLPGLQDSIPAPPKKNSLPTKEDMEFSHIFHQFPCEKARSNLFKFKFKHSAEAFYTKHSKRTLIINQILMTLVM